MKPANNEQMDTVIAGMNVLAYIRALMSKEQAQRILDTLDDGPTMKNIKDRVGDEGAKNFVGAMRDQEKDLRALCNIVLELT